eukprot:2179721-Ditylum_brightwellii.AAC.1
MHGVDEGDPARHAPQAGGTLWDPCIDPADQFLIHNREMQLEVIQVFSREYEVQKYKVIDNIVGVAPNAGRVKGILGAHWDSLWCEECIAVIMKGQCLQPKWK